jgi:hypothetical protein
MQSSTDNYENKKKFRDILTEMIPGLSGDELEMVVAQVLLTLKMDGVIGEKITLKEAEMVDILAESIMQDQDKRRDLLDLVNNLRKK